MSGLKGAVERHPVLSYIALCYAITWTVWFAIPIFAGDEWGMVKILTGLGLGPGLAAVILDRIRGTAGPIAGSKWWTIFAIVFVLVATINVSSMLTGDAANTQEIGSVEPLGLSAVGVGGSLIAAACCGFILASAACSRSRSLNSILDWRAPLRWWLVALFLVAVISVIGIGVTVAFGGEVPEWPGAGLSVKTWFLFALRSAMFTFLVVTVGEEPGWRGWMQPELQKRFSPLTTSILVGLVWGLWHLPLFFNGLYLGGPVGIFGYLIMCPALAVIFTWLYNGAGGNLLLALVLHTAFNNTSRVMPATNEAAWVGLALVIILIFTERMWRRPVAGSSRTQGAVSS